ncbi:MAG TPA: hypothetical protein VGR57_07230, partial [Ktedonobacterales bacterium]|nr:hypothetical protein [Ktedonobacterales bacterium]
MAKKRKRQATNAPEPRAPGSKRARAASEQLPRPDPDQPPIGAVTSRPSVASEWLNTSLQRPSARSAWLNTPTSAEPEGLTLAQAAEAQRLAQQDAQRQAARNPRRGATNAPGDAAPPAPRQRRASQARRLPASDRLASELQAMVEQGERERGGPQAAPAPRPRGTDRPTDPHGTGFLPTMKIDRTYGTHVLPALSDDDLRAAAPRPTNAPRQGQMGQMGQVGQPGQPRQATGQRPAIQPESVGPAPRGATAGRLPNARAGTAGPRMGTTNGPERGHGVTDPRLAITARETAAPLAGAGRGTGAPVGRGIPVDSGVLIRGARRGPKLSVAIVPRRLRPPSVVMQAL